MERVELEQHLIGNLLRNNEDFFKISFLRPEHFEDEALGRLFGAMRSKFESGEVVTPLSLKATYSSDEIKAISSMFCLLEMNDSKTLAEMVYKLWQREQIKNIFAKSLAEMNSCDNLEKLISDISKDLSGIAAGNLGKKFKSSMSVAEGIVKSIGEKLPFFSTGLMGIDNSMYGGLYKSRSYCIAARPKAGKTMMLGTISENLNQSGVKHLFIAAEMGSEEIYRRMLGRRINRSTRAFLSDNDSKEFRDKISLEAAKDANNLMFLDMPGITFSEMRTLLELAVYKYKIEGFILDYLQLVQGKEVGASDASHQQQIAQWIAEFCKKHNVWALYAAQMNREGEVRGSDGAIMAADWVYVQNKIPDGNMKGCVYLQYMASRYTEAEDIGDADSPKLRIAKTGTHITEEL